MTRKQVKIFSMVIIALIALLSGLVPANLLEGKQRHENNAVYIEKVLDGDSVAVNIRGKREQIRFIGIDAPELSQKPWGRRSKKFLEALISASGWQARIEYDVEKRDKFDRILAYLWGRNNKLINEEMLLNGYAVLFTIPPNVKHVDRLSNAQVIARENKRGIWGKGGLKQLPSNYRKEHPRR